MKVAIISPVPLFPVNAGNRSRTLNLARAIRSIGHDVHFIYLESNQTGGMDIDAHHAEFGNDRVNVLRRNGVQLWLYRAKRIAWLLRRYAARLLRSSHAWYNGLDEMYSRTFSIELRRLQRQHEFDAVFVEYVFYSRAFEAFPDSVIKILDTHDIFADRHVPFINRSDTKHYMFSVPPERECDGLRRAHAVLAIQSEEGDVLTARLGARDDPKVTVVSHLVDFADAVDCAAGSAVTFLGSNNQPNRDAVSFFIAAVLPLIVAKCPAFRLHLAGRISDAISDHPQVIKHGMVENAATVFTLAPISINPMLLGTGVNIKLLESMALGVPVVSTQTGARGVGAFHTHGLLVVPDDEPAAFAEAVLKLATDAVVRKKAGAAARETAKRWNAVHIESLSRVLSPSRVPVARSSIAATMGVAL